MASANAIPQTYHEAAAPQASSGTGGIMQIPVQVFHENFNRKPIVFEHNLASNPAFSMDRLHKLVEMSMDHPNLFYWDAGQKRIDQRWNDRPGRDFSVEEAFQRIRENGAWFIIFGAQRDPEIRDLLEAAMQQVATLSGYDLFKDVKVRSAYIFITAPKRITTYHIDRECNFLLQLHGNKTIHIFDQNDREVLPEVEIERFWSVDNNGATYKPEYQNRAMTVVLKPGLGVHLPVNAPHWLENGDDISVSLSMNFQFKNQLLGNIYRANHYLRKLGLKPTPPHQNHFADLVKGNAMQVPVAALKAYKTYIKHENLKRE